MTPTPPSAIPGDLSYGKLLRLTEGHGTSEIYERIARALSKGAIQLERSRRDVNMFERLAIEGAAREETLTAQLREREEELAAWRTREQETWARVMPPDARRRPGLGEIARCLG